MKFRVLCVVFAILGMTGCKYRFTDLPDASADAPGADAFDCGHTFCDDFDRVGPAEAGWDMLDTASGGTASIVEDIAISPPSSLRIDLPTMMTTTPTARAFIKKQLPMATTKAVISFSMSYATASTMNTEVDLVHLIWDTPSPGCTVEGFYLVRDGTGPFNLQETWAGDASCPTSLQHYNLSLDNQPMQNMRMEITFGPIGTAHMQLFVNDVSVVDANAAHAVEPSTITLELGAGCSRNGQTPWQVRYDDVIVDLQ